MNHFSVLLLCWVVFDLMGFTLDFVSFYLGDLAVLFQGIILWIISLSVQTPPTKLLNP